MLFRKPIAIKSIARKSAGIVLTFKPGYYTRLGALSDMPVSYYPQKAMVGAYC